MWSCRLYDLQVHLNKAENKIGMNEVFLESNAKKRQPKPPAFFGVAQTHGRTVVRLYGKVCYQ